MEFGSLWGKSRLTPFILPLIVLLSMAYAKPIAIGVQRKSFARPCIVIRGLVVFIKKRSTKLLTLIRWFHFNLSLLRNKVIRMADFRQRNKITNQNQLNSFTLFLLS